MLMKAGYFFSSILQGMMVVQFQRTSHTSGKISLDEYIQYDMYEDFVDAWRNTLYIADKCKMEQ